MPIDSEGVFEDSRTFYEKVCNVNLTVEEVPEDMAQSCLFSLTAKEIIGESIKAMKVWAMPLEETASSACLRRRSSARASRP